MGTNGRKDSRYLMRSRCGQVNGAAPRKRLKVIVTDKGYDAKVLRQQ
jgi:hypothetical protein